MSVCDPREESVQHGCRVGVREHVFERRSAWGWGPRAVKNVEPREQ